jgi:hypothetical protein
VHPRRKLEPSGAIGAKRGYASIDFNDFLLTTQQRILEVGKIDVHAEAGLLIAVYNGRCLMAAGN